MSWRVSLAFAFVAIAQTLSGVTISFSGHIDQSDVPDIAVATPFTGSIVYNASGALLGSGSNFANYSVGGPGYSITLNAGGFFFMGSDYLNMMVSDGPNNVRSIPNADVLDVNADTLSTLTTNHVDGVFFGLLAEFVGDLSFFSSNNIPDPFQTGSLFLGSAADPSRVFLFIDLPGAPNSTASGVMDSVTVVPEPGTWALLICGLAYVFGRRARA